MLRAAPSAATCSTSSKPAAGSCRLAPRLAPSGPRSCCTASLAPAAAQPRANTQFQSPMTCRVGRRESVFLFGFGGGNDEHEEEYTVCKLQVGVFGDIKTWQSKLNNIATKHDTDDEEGLHNILRDSLMLVLRNMEYAGYATSAGKVLYSIEEAEQKFNSVLMEERLKFKEETLVNVDGARKTRTLGVKGASDAGLDQWLCLSFLIATEGKLKLPKITSNWELKKVLTELGGLSADDLVAFELLWTPQEDEDFYTKQELLEDYPSMVTLS